jgi:hypothetical protein
MCRGHTSEGREGLVVSVFPKRRRSLYHRREEFFLLDLDP